MNDESVSLWKLNKANIHLNKVKHEVIFTDFTRRKHFYISK